MSITFNRIMFKDVFIELPDRPLWVFIYLWTEQLEAVQRGWYVFIILLCVDNQFVPTNYTT